MAQGFSPWSSCLLACGKAAHPAAACGGRNCSWQPGNKGWTPHTPSACISGPLISAIRPHLPGAPSVQEASETVRFQTVTPAFYFLFHSLWLPVLLLGKVPRAPCPHTSSTQRSCLVSLGLTQLVWRTAVTVQPAKCHFWDYAKSCN